MFRSPLGVAMNAKPEGHVPVRGCRDWVCMWEGGSGEIERWRRHDVRTHTNPASKTVVGRGEMPRPRRSSVWDGCVRRTTVHWGGALGVATVPRTQAAEGGLARVALGALTVRAVVAAPPCVAIAPVVAVTRAVAGAGVRTHAIRHGAEQPEQQYRPHACDAVCTLGLIKSVLR